MEGQIEDSSQPLVKVSAMLHETSEVKHKILAKRQMVSDK